MFHKKSNTTWDVEHKDGLIKYEAVVTSAQVVPGNASVCARDALFFCHEYLISGETYRRLIAEGRCTMGGNGSDTPAAPTRAQPA